MRLPGGYRKLPHRWLTARNTRKARLEHKLCFTPEAKWQRCVDHFTQRVDRSSDWQNERSGRHAEGDPCAGRQEDAKAAKENVFQIMEKLRIMRPARAAKIVDSGFDETLSYYSMPSEHWPCLRTNNPLERLMREIRCEHGPWARIPGWSVRADVGRSTAKILGSY